MDSFGSYAYPACTSSSNATAAGMSVMSMSDPSAKRERTKFNEQQLRYLEKYFEKCQYPQGIQREQMAAQLRLTETKVQVWFKNRRAKQRANKKYEDLCKSVNGARSDSSNSSHLSNKQQLQAPADSSTGINGKSSQHAAGKGNDAQCGSDNTTGGTEDENGGMEDRKPSIMGTKHQMNGRKSADGSIRQQPPSFPTSMPMIPLPSSLLDLELKLDHSANGAFGGGYPTIPGAIEQFNTSVTNTGSIGGSSAFSGMGGFRASTDFMASLNAGHTGWMSHSPMFNVNLGSAYGFTAHPSPTGYYGHHSPAATAAAAAVNSYSDFYSQQAAAYYNRQA